MTAANVDVQFLLRISFLKPENHNAKRHQKRNAAETVHVNRGGAARRQLLESARHVLMKKAEIPSPGLRCPLCCPGVN